MIGSIVLTVLGTLVLLGVGHKAVKDFGLPSLVIVLVAAAIVGLNFIPAFSWGEVTVSAGTILLLFTALFFLFFRGTLKNKLVTLLIVIALSASLYGAMRLAGYYGAENWSRINVYYGLIVGFLAFLLTRNTKYGFVSAVLSVAVASAVITRNIDLSYTPAVLAGGMAAVAYATASAVIPRRPGRIAYYFETGRMLD